MRSEFMQDVRFAVRWLAREPGFALLAVLTLSLGIGATTAAFGLVHGVLLAPLPYPDPDRIVVVREQTETGGENNVSWPNFEDLRGRVRGATLAAHTPSFETTVLGGAEALRPVVAVVSREFFEVLGTQPLLGRVFAADEQVPGGPAAVVVGESFWRRQLGGETDLQRLSLELMGDRAQVIGVMPASFSYPHGAELWTAIERTPASGLGSRTAHNFLVTARLAPALSLDVARTEMSAVMAEIREREPGISGAAVALHPLHTHMVADTRRGLLILLAASAFVLLVACTNLASSMIGRAARRRRELAVRVSLGASRARLIRQLLTESLVLAAIGAVGGLLLARVLVTALLQVAPDAVPRIDQVSFGGLVLGFTTFVTVLTAVLFGTAPALSATRLPPGAVLADSGRGTDSVRRRQGWSMLVGAEVALALMLLVGAGLLIRSLGNVLSMDTGFVSDDVVTVTLSLPEPKHTGEARVVFYDRLLEEVASVPGVTGVGLTRALPLVGLPTFGMFDVEGGEYGGGQGHYRVVSPGYFETMRIPVLQGRTFSSADVAGGLDVVVINQRLADTYFPDGDAIGRRIETAGMDAQGRGVYATIIGVVGDVRTGFTEPPPPAYYLPYAQRWDRMGAAALVVRTSGRPGALVAPLRSRIRALDADVPVEVATFQQRMGERLADRRFMLLVLGSFAGVALVLAAIGIHGVVAMAVSRRTREIGIRAALCAERSRILWLVSRGTMLSVLAGAAVGLAGALALSRVVAAFLYDVSTVDPLTFTGVAALLLAVAAVAVLLPAARATRIPPRSALMAE
ncbi:MAG TPA: ABC transporter permease [Longimicrobiales bacterium]|nr:ABC transporter permease [Longimicrobiales bacterium]